MRESLHTRIINIHLGMKFLEQYIDVNDIQNKDTLKFHTLMISKNSKIVILDKRMVFKKDDDTSPTLV